MPAGCALRALRDGCEASGGRGSGPAGRRALRDRNHRDGAGLAPTTLRRWRRRAVPGRSSTHMSTGRRGRLLAAAALSVALGCGGGGGSGEGGGGGNTANPFFDVGGDIQIAFASAIDEDTNDPGADSTPNDTPGAAQPLPNPVTLGGYVNVPGFGSSGRSQASGDPVDYYRVSLAARQT